MNSARHFADDLAFPIRRAFQSIRNMDGGINFSGMLLALVFIGIASIAIYANMDAVSKESPNSVAASGSATTQKTGSPPLPDPTEIVSLRVYPIKSCRGFEVSSTRLTRMGLTLDRNWMIIDKADRKFMTIRGESRMTLIRTRIIDGEAGSGKDESQQLEISIQDTDQRVAIPAFPTLEWLQQHTTLGTVEIWGAQTDAWEYGPAVNEMLSAFFAKDVALVYKGPTARHTAVNGSPALYGAAVAHHFADVMSVQVASQASINDLNARLSRNSSDGAPPPPPLTIERFRPNIIVRGRDDAPWQEDAWKRIRVTTPEPAAEALWRLDLDVVARCARCQVPNVDPASAAKHPRQPWDTLMTFRRVDKGGAAKYKPCFGMLCIPRNEGVIAVGAKVECLETTDKHLYNTAKFADL